MKSPGRVVLFGAGAALLVLAFRKDIVKMTCTQIGWLKSFLNDLLQGTTMAETLVSIAAKLDTLQTNVEEGFVTIQTTIDDLSAQISKGLPITQADLDTLSTKVDAVATDILSKEGAVGVPSKTTT